MFLNLLTKYHICSCSNDHNENYGYCCLFYASFSLFILLHELSCCRNYFFFGKELLLMFLFLLKLLISFRSHHLLDCIHIFFNDLIHFEYDYFHFFFESSNLFRLLFAFLPIFLLRTPDSLHISEAIVLLKSKEFQTDEKIPGKESKKFSLNEN